MIQRAQELFLVHDGVNTPLRDDSGLEHFLHGECLVSLLLLNLPDLPETSSADDVHECEVVFAHL